MGESIALREAAVWNFGNRQENEVVIVLRARLAASS
jgi:hypothetical protein